MTPHLFFTFRQVFRSSRQVFLFVTCVTLSICSITAISGFSESVNRAVMNDARKFHAADIIVRSNGPISGRLDNILSDWVKGDRIERAKIYEFNSIVRSGDDAASVLADVKIAEKGYPFYGRVILKSGRSFRNVLKSGKTVVESSLLDRLGVEVGDILKVGYISLVIGDVVLSEPDRPVNVFSFGPRVFIADEDRERLGLIQKGSRVHYIQLIKAMDGTDIDTLANQLKGIAETGEERIDTFRTAQSRFKRFLDNFLIFLKLVGFFIMVISGFGIQVTLTAFLHEKKTTIALMKTVGATNRYIICHFMGIVFILGFIGIVFGLFAGYGIQNALSRMLHSFLPKNIQLFVSWTGILEGILLGIAVLGMFTFFPLYRIKDTRPVVILRRDTPTQQNKKAYILSGLIFMIVFSGLIFGYIKDFQFGLYLIGGIFGLIIASYLVAELIFLGLGKLRLQRLEFRQALKGLFHNTGSTKPAIITLVASLGVIFSIHLIQKNLNASFVQSYPPKAPNVFFIDIQPSQLKAFLRTVGGKISVYPVVRARIVSINGIKIDLQAERRKRGDRLSRIFNLTYRDSLLQSERLTEGRELYRNDWQEPQVSVLDMVLEMRSLHIGDRIEFNIQGVPLTARISSIRTQEMETMSPFFYFVLPESVLGKAPQTIFSALHLEKERVGPLQTQIVSQFPNITVIDVTEAIKTFSGLLARLSSIIQFFALLSMAAGLLILVSAVFATRKERIVEAVYYKVLGAKNSFVLKVFTLENMMIGLISSLLAITISHVAVYLICKYTFEISYRFLFLTSTAMVIAAVLLVVVIGIAASKSILDQKPITILKEQPDG